MTTDLLPVIVGGDIGVYAIGRSFHEAYGCRCICLAASPTEAITRSVFFDVETLPPHADDRQTLAVLRGLAAANPGRKLVLMANDDRHSVFVGRYHSELEKAGYSLPFPPVEVTECVTDKAQFAQICTELGIDTPRTVSVNVGSGETPSLPFDFPVVAKAARGDAYDQVDFPGKRKIYFIETAAELDELWATLRKAGFDDTFLVQELIPGDNTQMRSITAYVDSHGDVTMIGSARVLLEDHAPTMIGNPVAMITEPFDDLWDSARAFLTDTGYRGFANFDVKVDPRDGRAVFFEVNPRIGRNSWYMSAAGVNPMSIMVRDLIDHEHVKPQEVHNKILYSLVPDALLRHYVRDEELRQRVHALQRSGKRKNPLVYTAETSLVRSAIVALQTLNHIRKFRRFYPEATDRSF